MKLSVPLTLLLLRLFIEDGAIDLGEGRPNGGLTAQQKRNIRDVARYGLNRVAMLRKDDCSPDKQTVGHYQEVGQRHEGRLMVDPGKAHSTHVFAEVPGATELAGGIVARDRRRVVRERGDQRLRVVEVGHYTLGPAGDQPAAHVAGQQRVGRHR